MVRRARPAPVALSVAAMREADRRAIEEFGIPGVVLMENAGPRRRGRRDRDAEGRRESLGGHRRRSRQQRRRRVRHRAASGQRGRRREGAPAGALRRRRGRRADQPRRHPQDASRRARDRTCRATRASSPKSLPPRRSSSTRCWAPAPRAPSATRISPRSTSSTAPGRPILAVDIPSGLDADTGEPLGTCVVAAHTVTFAAPKTGMLNPAAARYLGVLTVVDIGLPRELLEERR